jgi:hypothetical protein
VNAKSLTPFAGFAYLAVYASKYIAVLKALGVAQAALKKGHSPWRYSGNGVLGVGGVQLFGCVAPGCSICW